MTRKYRASVRLTLEWSGEIEADGAPEAIRIAKTIARGRYGDEVDSDVSCTEIITKYERKELYAPSK